ncbi:50S ribosomal protein L11 methyltransferase [Sulfurospirillum barnesii]|uniref:Ribosomal protein L11 methyltransferase n=1 Tax=Sulfurospirillum barnesii (strain ATCC 700032 / DSM 10660 / SES-3) TaxID=760154 RepID=I3XYV4_SULBS|nr:50S ribosomal protein L11 methyltransferase [Sulfurospirillum barnesii]AFL69128.1 ribosomal protein L11 methyltransferase [Sulfurospirillum barnesii SES-3]
MNKTYNELHITPSGEYPLFLDMIMSLNDEAVEELNGTLIVRSEEDLSMLRFGIETFAEELSKLLRKTIHVDIAQYVKENEDWIANYRNSIQPLHVGDFYIRPSWIPQENNKKNIIIDPALAFGSGHHETTYGCLLLLQKYVKEGTRLLDVGCGSGILSIAARKCGAIVDLCDTDEQATHSAKENFELNDEVYETLWTGSVQKRTGEYDVVIANIIADVLIMLSSDLKQAVKEGGYLILSGILDKYVDKVENKFSSMTLVERFQKEEWFTLVLKRN